MPGDYNPYAGYVGGQLLMQGMSNFGQGVAEGMNTYVQNKQKSALAEGQIEPYLKGLIASKDSLDPAFGKVVDRYANGNATLADKMQLVGHIQTLQTQKLQDAENQQRQQAIAQMSQQTQMGQMELMARQRQQEMLNRMMGGGQSMQGAPSQATDQTQTNQQSPSTGPQAPGSGPRAGVDMQSFIQRYVQSTGSMPPPQVMEQVAKTQLEMKQPIGFVQRGSENDSSGIPVNHYYRVMQKGDGSIEEEKEPVKAYANQAFTGQLLNPKTYQPIATPQSGGAGGMQPMPPTKEQQEALGSAVSDLNALQMKQKRLDELMGLNDQLNKVRWSRLAPLTGTSKGNALETILAGDTIGTNFDSLSSSFVSDLMSGVKNMRNLQEFKAVTGAVPKSSMDADTRAARLADLKQNIGLNIARTSKALENLRAGALPSSAWDNASSETAKTVTPAVPETKSAGTYGTSADVVNAFKSGKINRAEAKQILQKQFGMQ